MIDWDRVGELREEVGAEDFGDIVDLFLSEVETAIDGLESATSAPVVEEQMHFLKGAALNLGFADLSALTERAEKAAAKGEESPVAPNAVRACFEESRVAFAKGYTERFAA